MLCDVILSVMTLASLTHETLHLKTVRCYTPPPYSISRSKTSIHPSPMASTVSYEINREDARHQYDRRAHVTGTIKARERNQRQNDKARSIWFYPNSPDLEVAPKYTRHQEEYINPHLLEHERPIIAPRYGPNSVCKNFRPRPVKCRCDFCLSTAQTNENKRREAAIALNKVVGPVRAGVRKGAPFPDWDTSSFNCPHSYDGDIDWMRDYGDDKPAPPAQLDLMAMAKPAKKKKKKAASRRE